MLLLNFPIPWNLNILNLFEYFNDVRLNINLMISIQCYYLVSNYIAIFINILYNILLIINILICIIIRKCKIIIGLATLLEGAGYLKIISSVNQNFYFFTVEGSCKVEKISLKTSHGGVHPLGSKTSTGREEAVLIWIQFCIN